MKKFGKNKKMTLEAGLEYHQQGHLDRAAAIYREVLKNNPNQEEALHLLGLLTFEIGNAKEAIALLEKAVVLNPDAPHYHSNLAQVFRAQGEVERAIAHFQTAVELSPSFTEARDQLAQMLQQAGYLPQAIWHYRELLKHQESADIHYNLANLLKAQQNFEAAIAHYQRAIALQPDFADAYNNLGNVIQLQGQFDQALDYYQKALALTPNSAETYNNLGSAYQNLEQYEKAERSYQKALEFKPDYAEAYNNRGNVMQKMKRMNDAINDYKRALALKPDFAEAHNNLGRVLFLGKQYTDGIIHCRKALELKPDYAQAHNNLGNLLYHQGEYQEALTHWQRALELNPNEGEIYGNLAIDCVKRQGDYPGMMENFQKALAFSPQDTILHSNFLFYLTTHPDLSEAQQFQYFQEWESCHRPHVPVIAFSNIPEPNRRLKIGYVSPDFWEHVAASIFDMLFKNHDPQKVEIYAYAEVNQPDETTEHLKSYCHHWRSTVGLSHEEMANMIHKDKIDILVDLAGHTQNNRLPVFALKPAPIQVTAFGFNGTTGLKAIDYRFSDPWVTPPESEKYHTETIVHLSSMLHWQAPNIDLALSSPPFQQTGFITFGSANNLYKLNDRVLTLWGQILKKVPDSRLLIKSLALDNINIQSDFSQRCKQCGIAIDRLKLIGKTDKFAHFDAFNQMDIALDPFPYNGCMTSCETFWMGVPTVALNSGLRVSASLLNSVGLVDLLAENEEAYVNIACQLADDHGRLIEIRHSLRDRLLSSPICDGAKFAQEVEDAYREMWKRWIAESGA